MMKKGKKNGTPFYLYIKFSGRQYTKKTPATRTQLSTTKRSLVRKENIVVLAENEEEPNK